MSDMKEEPAVEVDEQVVLSKFESPDGSDSTAPEHEFERLTVSNGLVVSHDRIENGEVAGPVEDGNLTGVNVGTLTQ